MLDTPWSLAVYFPDTFGDLLCIGHRLGSGNAVTRTEGFPQPQSLWFTVYVHGMGRGTVRDVRDMAQEKEDGVCVLCSEGMADGHRH